MRKVFMLLAVVFMAAIFAGCQHQDKTPAVTPTLTQAAPAPLPSQVQVTPFPDTPQPHPQITGQWVVTDSQAVRVGSVSSWSIEADPGDTVAFTSAAFITPYSLAIPYTWLDADHLVLHLEGEMGLAVKVELNGQTLTLRTYFGEHIATLKKRSP